MRDRVDVGRAGGYFSRFRASHRLLAGAAPLVVTVLLACAARGEPPGTPVHVEPIVATDLATPPGSPLWITFDWEAREREARYTGRGTARVAPPDLARLDLFGPRGESYLSAAVVEGELRLPPSADSGMVPPPALLWGALGVFQPPEGAELTSSTRNGSRLRLSYRNGDERWSFDFESDRLTRVEWNGTGGARKSVELKGEGKAKIPREAVYRDWRAFTELKIKVGEVEEVDSFPPEIWQLHGH